MDIKGLSEVAMKHEGEIKSNNARIKNVEMFCTKHANQHFQLRIFAIAQLVILIGLVIGVIIGIT